MGGLPDINTERPSFQDYFIEFINDCIACGADGFRYDTAKHIGLPDDSKEDDGFNSMQAQRTDYPDFYKRVYQDKFSKPQRKLEKYK
jgi:alpha-amylase